MTIGQRIRERRMALNMSVDDLAKRLGKNKATIYRYEKGEIENMPVDMLEPLAAALEISPAWIMGWGDPKENLLGAEIYNDGVHMTYVSNNPIHLKQIKNWYNEFGGINLTDEEHQELINYTHYLIYKRDK